MTHAWRSRPESARGKANRALLEDVYLAHAESGGAYGALRVHAVLRALGRRVGRHRVARLMRRAGLRGLTALPRRVRTTDSRHGHPIVPNRLGRNFEAAVPNQVWLADLILPRFHVELTNRTASPVERRSEGAALAGEHHSEGITGPALRGSMRDFTALKGPDLLGRCENFYTWQAERREAGVWPFSRATERGPSASCAVRDDRGRLACGVNFASQDYLSLSSHPAVAQAVTDAVDGMGVHSAGSPALVGNTATSVALERSLAEFLGTDEVVLFPTGWAAGFGVIKGLVRSHDHVVMDALAHACLQAGARAATGNVTLFRHLSVDDCREKLAAIRGKDPAAGIMVVTEGLFSMNSDTPDIAAMQTLARESGATLVVDAAHDLGNLGPGGTGHIGLQGMLGEVDLVMGSFSKTFASNGGFVATRSRAVKEYLRFFSSPCTFSNALSPLQVAAVAKALEIVRSPEGARLRDDLMRNVLHLRGEIQRRGMDVYGDPSAIVGVRVGDEALARLVARELPSLGLLANLVEFPAVARGQARFRLQVMAGHSAVELETAAACMKTAQRFAEHQLDAMTHGIGVAGA